MSEALPVQWDQHEGIRWDVPVRPGSSSPIVCGNHLFFTSETIQQGDTTLCMLHCLDRLTGIEQWSIELGSIELGSISGATHRKNGFTAATPACDGTRVLTCIPQLGVFCHTTSGKLVWHRSLGKVSHKWGFASSPVLYAGMVIQLCDSEQQSHLTALAVDDGQLVWQTPRNSQGCWTTPVISNFGRDDLLIVNGTGSTDGSAGEVIAYDPLTGSEHWRVTGTTDLPCPTAIVTDQLIISTSGGNGPVLAIAPPGSGSQQPNVVWRHAAGGPYVPTGITYDDLLYVVSDGGVLTCYRVDDGEKLYRKRLQGTFSASLLAGDGKIYLISEQGDCYVIAAGEEYALLSTNRMRDRCLASPAVAYDHLFLRTESTLYCIAGSASETAPQLLPVPGKAAASPSDSPDQQPEQSTFAPELKAE